MVDKNKHFICCLLGVALVFLAVVPNGRAADDGRLGKATRLLEDGKAIDALEAFSRLAGENPDNREASAGIKAAKNKIRQQMGDVSASRLNEMLTRLDEIDTRRVRELTAQIADLQDARDHAVERIAALESDLGAARTAQAAAAESESAQLAAIRRDLNAARDAAKLARDNEVKLAGEIQAIRREKEKDYQAANERIESLVAQNERIQTEKRQIEGTVQNLSREARDLGIKLARLEAENRDLSVRNQALAEQKKQLDGRVAQLLRQEVPAVKPDHELAILQAENKDLKDRNQALALEIKKGVAATAKSEPAVVEKTTVVADPALGRAVASLEAENKDLKGRNQALALEIEKLAAATAKPEPTVVEKTTVVTDPALGREIALLEAKVLQMDRDLRLAEKEKTSLLDKMARLQADLGAKRSEKYNQRLRGAERDAASQSLGIKQLESSIGRAQSHCEELAARLGSRAGSAADRSDDGTAQAKLADLKTRLARLEGALPTPVAPPEKAAINNRRLLSAQAKQLADDTSALQSDIAAAEVSVGQLERDLDTDGASYEKRLRKMDAIHEDASQIMERLRQQLREAEALIEDAG